MNSAFNLNLGNGYVLAAEDSLVQAKRLTHLFDNYKIAYKIFKNGAEALAQAKLEKPLLIISDVVMPVMDGYEFCATVKADKELRNVPFVLLTSLSDPLDIIKGLQAGADNFITKPYEESYLISRINYLLTNLYIRQQGASDMSIEIMFQNQRFQINSDKKQILDLLLSVYEAAISRNSQLVEAQNQLQKLNQDLESANQELEAFARTVSHDLRTPLNGVIGFGEILKADFSDRLDDAAIEYLDWILGSAGKMSILIEDLLAFSRSGNSEIVSEKVNLSEMTKEVVADLQKVTYPASCKVNVQDGVTVFADPKMMRVVLNNLLGNALKYSQKVENPEIEFGKTDIHGKQVVYARDNGAGFDMKDAKDLFSPFIRLHSKKDFQGTGIGLSTVKRIIERHGGEIWFESAPNQGAVFYFTLE
jgi:two-component system, sensor histidine kinase and response regulator